MGNQFFAKLNLLRVRGSPFKHALVNIAERDAIDLRVAQESLKIGESLTTATYQTEVDLVIRSNRLRGHSKHKWTHREASTKCGTLFHKLSSCHIIMCLSLFREGQSACVKTSETKDNDLFCIFDLSKT